MKYDNYNYSELKSKVLSFLDTLKSGSEPYEYLFCKNGKQTIYSSLFALFILDLFNEIKNFSDSERINWINYIQSYQDFNTGLFIAKDVADPNSKRNKYQLTSFSLSALDILNATPLYDLKFLSENFPTKQSVSDYLIKYGCHKGKDGSGNFAMFLGVFLTYEYEKTKSDDILEKIETWFEFHNSTQNKKTGFWGKGIKNDYYEGFQNALHQFLVYKYHNRPYPNIDRAFKRIIILQDNEGLFHKIPGGFGCYEYDALEFIIYYITTHHKLKQGIKKKLIKSFNGILSLQKEDNGFPLMKKKRLDIIGFLIYFRTFICLYCPILTILKIKIFLYYSKKKFNKQKVYFNWVNTGCLPTESNLWDTWMRTLSIALLSKGLQIAQSDQFKFQKFIGIGYD